MNQCMVKLAIISFCFFIIVNAARAQEIRPPAADETLIYVMRVGRFSASASTLWIAVNSETVGRLKNGKYTVIRAKADAITLSLARAGMIMAAIALDDRPGETVYLKWRFPDRLLTEVDEAEGKNFLRKSKQTKEIKEILPNKKKEQILAMMSLSKLGFDMMRPAKERLEPDGNHAVISIFRRNHKLDYDLGIWSADGYLGDLSNNEGLEIRLPAGTHYLLSGEVGTTLLKAQVEAGQRYYVQLELGKMVLRTKLSPVERKHFSKLQKWLAKVKWVEVRAEALTDRIREREEVVARFVKSARERAETGEADFYLLSSEHAF